MTDNFERDRKKKLKQAFANNFNSDLELYKNITEASNVGAPMFSVEDLKETAPVLDRLLKFFCIKKKISSNLFKRASMDYDRFMGVSEPTMMNTNWTNISKIFRSDRYKNGLTYFKLNHILSNILGYVVTDIKITTQNVYTEEVIEVSLSEIEQFLRDESKKDKKGEK